MARPKSSRTGRCQGCNHLERVRIERLLAAGASIKAAARKFAIDYHALRRHWRNHVSAEARVDYIAGAGASKDQLEAIVADEALALLDHYRIVRGMLYKGFSAAAELWKSWQAEPWWRRHTAFPRISPKARCCALPHQASNSTV
jgi:hypothetical protein